MKDKNADSKGSKKITKQQLRRLAARYYMVSLVVSMYLESVKQERDFLGIGDERSECQTD